MKNSNTIPLFAEQLRYNLALVNRPDGKYLRRQQVRLRNRCFQTFKKQMNWIIKEMESLRMFRNNSVSINTLDSELEEFAGRIPKQEKLVDDIVLYAGSSMNRGGKKVVRQFKLAKVGISFDLSNPQAVKYLTVKRTLELSNSKGTIFGTTKKKIIGILRDAAASGQSYQKTSQLIQEQGAAGVFSQARGEMIAVREVGHAYEYGKKVPMQEFRIKYPERPVEKYWKTVGDDNVTDECRDNEGRGNILFEETFPSGDEEAPRDDHPRCRCKTNYKILKP